MYNIVPATVIRASMLPNSAMVEMVNFFNKKIKESADQGGGSFAISRSNTDEYIAACPTTHALPHAARLVALETIRDAFIKEGYDCQLFSAQCLISIHWTG